MNSSVSGTDKRQRTRRAIGVWLACHRLGDILDDLSAQAPPASSLCWPKTRKSWLIPSMPANQLAFQQWLHTTAIDIFGCDGLPDRPMILLDAPQMKEHVVYGTRCGAVNFYAVPVECWGIFVDWLRIRQSVG